MKKALGWFLIIVFLLSGCLPFQPMAGSDPAATSGKPLRPVEVTIVSTVTTQTDARLVARVTANTQLTGLSLKWDIPEGMAVLEGVLESTGAPAREETREFEIVVRKTAPGLKEVRVEIQYQALAAQGTASDVVYLGQDPSAGLRIVPLEEALGSPQLPTLDARPVDDNQPPPLPPGASSGMITTGTPEEKDLPAEPQAGAVTITITGKLFYPDFGVSSVGVSNAYTSRPIRGATIKVKKGFLFANTVATRTTTHDGVNDGQFTLAFKAKIGDHVRIEVQAKNKHVTVDNLLGKPWTIAAWEDLVITSPTMDLGDHTIWDDSWSDDKKEETGVFNILDIATSGMETLDEAAYLGTKKLHYTWFIGNPVGTAYYPALGRVFLLGKTDDSDHWDDNIILHEMGHWVMDKYAQSVPNATGEHGDCTYAKAGRPGLAYSEGWASFFSFAVREKLGDNQFDWYLDSVGWIGEGGGGRDHETTNLVGDAYIDRDTGLGNWCEYQVAAALLDVLDSNADDNDNVDRTFSDIYAAFRGKVNGHFPYNINEWWYGWTNSAGGRGANPPSLGDEQNIINLFTNDHAFKLGVRFETSSPDAAKNASLNPHLWTPYPRTHIGQTNPGDQANAPYAFYGAGDKSIWISSPQKSIYKFGVSGLFDMAASQGIVKVWDASKVDDWFLVDGAAPGCKCEAWGLWTLLPGNRSKVWWYALDYTPTSAKLTCRNKVQDTAPGTPYTPSGIVSGAITDATNQPLADTVTVCVKGTQNCTQTGTGQYTLTGVPSGKVKLTAKSDSYISLTQEVLVAPEVTTTLNFVLSPILNPGEWRIVLTWQAAPRDIDSHLWVPVTSTSKAHVYYGSRGSCTASPYACLDVDDTTGYGPETITIKTRFNRAYSYKVYNYSNETSLAGSQARVRVYKGSGLVKDVVVPVNGSGRWWHVFDITASGSISMKNTLSDVSGMSAGLDEEMPEKEPLE